MSRLIIFTSNFLQQSNSNELLQAFLGEYLSRLIVFPQILDVDTSSKMKTHATVEISYEISGVNLSS